MKVIICNDHCTVGRGWSHIQQHDGYLTGDVATEAGFVLVYSQKDLTSFRFIYKGHQFYQSQRRGFTTRGLASKARQFAKRIVDEVDNLGLDT